MVDDDDLSSCLITIDDLSVSESRKESFLGELDFDKDTSNECYICGKEKELVCNWKQLFS